MPMARNLSVRTRLLGLGGAALVMATLLGATGLWCISRAAAGAHEVARSGEALRHHLEGDMMHDALRGDVLGAFLAQDDAAREAIGSDLIEHSERFREAVAANRALGLANELERALASVGPALEAYVESARETVEIALADPEQGRAALPAFLERFGDLEERMEAASDLIENYSKATAAQSAELESFAQRTMLAIWIAASVILLAAAWSVARSITRPVGEMQERLRDIASGDGDLTKRLAVEGRDEMAQLCVLFNQFLDNLNQLLGQVRSAAQQLNGEVRGVAESSSSISAGAQSQAASLEQTAASLEELTSTVQGNADNAERTSKLVDEARSTASDGQGVVNSAVDAMKTLESSSSRIGAIVSIIDDIAFQTNLLALNAAVEAARAGEQGRGFAVVASEVRSLAKRSSDAAKEIKGLIEDSATKVGHSTELVLRSGASLKQIVDSVQRISAMTNDIAQASRGQSDGIAQIHKAVSQMDTVVQQNSSRTEELSAAAEMMAGAADRMSALVARFKLNTQVEQARQAEASTSAGEPAPIAPSRAPRDRRSETVAARSGADDQWS